MGIQVINHTEYIEKLKKQKSRSWRWVGYLLILSIVCFLVAFGLDRIITFNLLNIPLAAKDYLLHTLFWKFSNYHLKEILLNEVNSTELNLPLLAIYWCFQILFVSSLMLSMGAISFLRMDHGSRSWGLNSREKAILNNNYLQRKIKDFMQSPNRRNKWKVLSIISFVNFYKVIIPIRQRWFKQYSYQWFPVTAIDRDIRSIIFCLSKFQQLLRHNIDTESEIDVILSLLQLLDVFFLSSTNRIYKDELRINYDELGLKDKTEREILTLFAQQTRPLIIHMERYARKLVIEDSKIILWFKKIYASEIIRYGFAISLIAAFIMMPGIFLFGITPSQAFLTWFTVAFSSLTISVGVTSFRNEERPQ